MDMMINGQNYPITGIVEDEAAIAKYRKAVAV